LKSSAKEHAAMAQSRELQRAKAIQDRQDMLVLVRSRGYRTPDEFNAAKVAEFLARGRKI